MKPCSIAPALLSLCLAWITPSCQKHAPGEPPVTLSPDGVPCVNLPADQVDLLEVEPAHPLIIQGVVSALREEQSSLLESFFLSTAHAFTLEQESSLEGARIELFEVPRAPLPDTLPEPLLSTTSDRRGRYCLVLPHPIEQRESSLFLLVATPAQENLPPMRQVLTHSFDADLNAMSEAFTQALSPHLSTRLTNAHLLNMRTLGETRLGLLSPDLLDGIQTQRALIERAVERLQHDDDVRGALSLK